LIERTNKYSPPLLAASHCLLCEGKQQGKEML
jgi:hypothetical protein